MSSEELKVNFDLFHKSWDVLTRIILGMLRVLGQNRGSQLSLAGRKQAPPQLAPGKWETNRFQTKVMNHRSTSGWWEGGNGRGYILCCRSCSRRTGHAWVPFSEPSAQEKAWVELGECEGEKAMQALSFILLGKNPLEFLGLLLQIVSFPSLFCPVFTTSIWRAVQKIWKAKPLGTWIWQTQDSHIWLFLSPSNLCKHSWKSHATFWKRSARSFNLSTS